MKENHFSISITPEQGELLRGGLESQGFTFSTPPYTRFSAKKPGVQCTLYESGKLTVQGAEIRPFIEFYLEPEVLQATPFTYRSELIDKTPRIGIDEAGKGDFFGPLCIAGVYADEAGIKALIDMGVKDSKTLSDVKIHLLAEKIEKACTVASIALFPIKYNELYERFGNLNRLLGWGHAAAITELTLKTGCKKVIIDQFASPHIVINALKQKKTEVELTQRHKGEEDIVVAAASIIARDRFVQGLAKISEPWLIALEGKPLPKGASSIVRETGKKLVKAVGVDALSQVAKTHFKTFEECLSD